jgi:hypothetical protein
MKRIVWLVFVLLFPLLCDAGTVRSRGGRFTATVVTGAANSGKRHGTATWTVGVAGEDGVQRYRVEKEVPYGSPFPGATVCDDGRLIVVDAFAGFVEFMDETGIVTRIWRPFSDAGPDHERILKCSTAGTRAAFLLSGSGIDVARVVMCTTAGDAEWKKELQRSHGSEIYLASDASATVVSSYSSSTIFQFSTEVLDGQGRIIRSVAMLMRHASIDPESGLLAMADRDSAEIYSPGRNGREGCWRISVEGECIMGIATLTGEVAILTAKVTAGASGVDVTQPTMVIVGAQGSEVEHFPVDGASGRGLSIRTGSVKFVVSDELELITIPVTYSK